MSSQFELSKQIISIFQKMESRGYVVATDGNVSTRFGDKHFLVSPSGIRKSSAKPQQVVKCLLNGKPVSSTQKPSSEIAMHVRIYEHRSDVTAVVHAHPPYTVALSIAKIPFDRVLMPEAAVVLGKVFVVPYFTPTTKEVDYALDEKHLHDGNTFVLERHGTVTFGDSLEQAYQRLEVLEHTSKIFYLAYQLGGAMPMDNNQIDHLFRSIRA